MLWLLAVESRLNPTVFSDRRPAHPVRRTAGSRIRRTVERGLQTGRCVIRSLVIPPCIRKQVRKSPTFRRSTHPRQAACAPQYRPPRGRCGVRLHLRPAERSPPAPAGAVHPPADCARSARPLPPAAPPARLPEILVPMCFMLIPSAPCARPQRLRAHAHHLGDGQSRVRVCPAALAGLVLHDNVKALPFLVIILCKFHLAVPHDGRECIAVPAGQVALAGQTLPRSPAQSRYAGRPSANQSSCPFTPP